MHKYMNHYFGKKMFKHAHFKAADPGTESGGANGGGSGASEPENEDGSESESGEEPDKPSYDDLVAELAKARTEAMQAQAARDKYKNSIDDLTRKNGELTKQVRNRMSAAEQIDAAKKEAEEARRKEFDEMKSELATIRATKRYMVLEMEENLATETAKAEISGDMETVISNIAKHIKTIKDTAYQKALKDRPDPKAGNGDANDENASALEMAAAYAGRQNGVNMDILNQY